MPLPAVSALTLIPQEVVPKRTPRTHLPERDRKAHAITAKAVAVVFAHVEGVALTREQWRTRNKAAALDLVDAGKTPEQVCAMLEVAYTHPDAKQHYYGLVKLASLASSWPRLAALAAGTAPVKGRKLAPTTGAGSRLDKLMGKDAGAH